MKMKEFKMSMTERLIKAKREEFLNDSIVKNFNSLLVRIYTYAMPAYIISAIKMDDYDQIKQNQIFTISDGTVIKQVFDQKIQKQIDEVVKK